MYIRVIRGQFFMKILIIGGTKFLGRHLIDAAIQNQHEVTLFNRGRHYAEEAIFGVEQIHGDRNSDLDKLSGRNWDAVVDTCGYLPETVARSADYLKDSVDRYVFISSGSVYADTTKPNYDESTNTAKLSEIQLKAAAEIDPKGELNGLTLGENYGALKVLCEEAAEKDMPGRVLSVRAGMIVGAFDWTDRFAYWVLRIAKGGEILAPGTSKSFVQLIDARDLSEWIIQMIEMGEAGIFNVTSKPFELTFGNMLEAMRTAVGSDCEFVWADENFLMANEVTPWSDMPFYLPESDEFSKNFLTMNVDKALAKGLKFLSLSDTTLETLKWRKAQDFEMRAGISGEREKELLEKLT